MSNFLRQIGNCCSPCRDPQVSMIPGPQGDPGEPCEPCSDGINAFSTVEAAGPVAPAVGANVDIEVSTTAWMVEGQDIIIGPPTGALMGYYTVISIIDDINVTVQNTGDAINAPPGTAFAIGQKISPAGPAGASAAGAGVADTQACTPGVSTQLFTHALGVVPNVLVCTVHKPLGGMNIFATVHSLTAANFTADFSGTIPGAGYSVEFVAYP